jgi:hypothetical protein
MSRNIYDVFNERKEGLDSLMEGYQAGDYYVEDFDNMTDGIRVLDRIMQESTMDLIEYQGAMHLEDLVLENMMYENFDTEEIAPVIEATMKERAGNLWQKVKNLWEKIKAWFKKMFAAIKNFFISNNKLLAKYEGQIAKRIKACDVEVNCHEWNDPTDAINDSYELLNLVKLEADEKYKSKDDLLKAIHVKDKKEIVSIVKKFFMSEKASKRKISSMDAGVVEKYVSSEKYLLDNLNKERARIDLEFKNCLDDLKADRKSAEGDEKKDLNKMVNTFQFGINLKTAMINAMVACIKKGAGECRAIILRAVGNTSAPADDEEPANKPEIRSNAVDQMYDKTGSRAGATQTAADARKMADRKNNVLLNSWIFEDEDLYDI